MVKKLYDWVLSWSTSPWGWLALFIIALFEASWFPLPPDVLLIALCIGASHKSFRFASICLAGSVLGAALAYGIGHFAWISSTGEPTAFAQFFYDHIFSQQVFNNVSDIYKEWDFIAVFTAGFTPVPFKIFTISAGMCDINFVMFILASIVSRGLRFFLVAWLIWKYGEPIKGFIDKYLNLLATLLAVLLIGITALIFVYLGDEETPAVEPTQDTTTNTAIAVEKSLADTADDSHNDLAIEYSDEENVDYTQNMLDVDTAITEVNSEAEPNI